jgi:ribosomal protein S18 acetylase RimI-like enzyme
MPFLHQLYAELRAPELAILPWDATAKAGFVASQFALQHHHFTAPGITTDRWIVEIDGADAGRLYVHRARPLWHLADIALSAATRGRGAGTALIAWLQRTARDAGACGIDLHVLVTNRRAAALYARRGFCDADGDSDTHRRMLWRVS